MSNLFDYRCPKCSHTDQIDICAEVWVLLTADGTDADASGNGDHLYNPESSAECGHCSYNGKVADFDPDMAAKGGAA